MDVRTKLLKILQPIAKLDIYKQNNFCENCNGHYNGLYSKWGVISDLEVGLEGSISGPYLFDSLDYGSYDVKDDNPAYYQYKLVEAWCLPRGHYYLWNCGNFTYRRVSEKDLPSIKKQVKKYIKKLGEKSKHGRR